MGGEHNKRIYFQVQPTEAKFYTKKKTRTNSFKNLVKHILINMPEQTKYQEEFTSVSVNFWGGGSAPLRPSAPFWSVGLAPWSLAKNGWILQIVASALRTEAQECTLLTNVWHCVVDMDSLKSQKLRHLLKVS